MIRAVPPATFRVRFDGTLMPGADIEEVKTHLARIFRQERAKIEPLFAGRTVTIKRGLSEADARKYVETLRRAGGVARMEAEEPVAPVQMPARTVSAAPGDEGTRKAPPPLELALAPKDDPPPDAGHDNGSASALPTHKSPIAALADLLQEKEEYCGLSWYSPLERIGRLRLMARSGVLMGMMLAIAFVGSSIIARAFPVFLGGLLLGIIVSAAACAYRFSNAADANFMEDRPGASLLDISLFFGIPALLIILAIGMASRLQLMVDLDHSRAQVLFHTGIFTSIVVAVTRILLMTQQIRRLRDVNRSGWWCLLFLIPYLGPIFFLLLILKGGDEESNEYGLPPPPNTLGVHLGVVLFVAIAIFALASSEATSLRLPARFFLGLTTMFRPEAPKVPEVPQAMPQQSAPPVFQPGAGNAPDPSSSGPQKKSPLDDLNDFTRYSNKKLHLRQAFQQAGNALRTAEGNAQALEQWSSSEDALVNALQFQVAQARESIEVRKRDRATPVSSSLPRFADIFDQGIGRTQDIMERLEGLYADLLARAQRTGIDKAFQKELDRFKYALNTLKLDHGIMYAETRREMCAYTRNPDDWLREYQSSRGLQTEKENMEAEWCD